jgi:hypothetical protein
MAMFQTAIVDYIAHPATQDSQTKTYLEFCAVYEIEPWPATETILSAWALILATCIKAQCIPGYISGVRYHQRILGVPAPVERHGYISCTLRYIKRKYGVRVRENRVSLTMPVVRTILALLPGWPVLADLSHDDRMFAAASVIGLMGCLRGGEFLFSTGKRPLLRFKHIKIRSDPVFQGVIVTVERPKAKPWQLEQDVRCFNVPGAGVFNAAALFRAYRDLSCVPLTPEGPAFANSAGHALTRDAMVARTTALLQQADIVQLDPEGNVCVVEASSWRAGAVRSGRDANLSDPIIMAWGRWSSSAWTNYLSQTAQDLKKAAESAWNFTEPTPQPADFVWVGESARPVAPAAVPPALPADYVTVHFDRLACRSLGTRRRSVGSASLPSDYLAFQAANPG